MSDPNAKLITTKERRYKMKKLEVTYTNGMVITYTYKEEHLANAAEVFTSKGATVKVL